MTPRSDGEANVPIACGVHDRLESWAVRRTRSPARRRRDAPPPRRDDASQRAVIADVFAQDGADGVVLEAGETVRADRLVTVGGVDVARTC